MPVPATLLPDQKTAPALTLLPGLTLPFARLHEACGTARMRFALWVAARLQGPVFWIAPEWQADRLNPCGIRQVIDPTRIIFIRARREVDILWSMEEIMRSGATALAVAELPGPPGLTPVRRIHLAAETGRTCGAGHAPLGLILTPGNGQTPGVETRWHLVADHGAAPGHWRLKRLRARTAPPAEWHISYTPTSGMPRFAESPPIRPGTDRTPAHPAKA
jgi:protein ImuA